VKKSLAQIYRDSFYGHSDDAFMHTSKRHIDALNAVSRAVRRQCGVKWRPVSELPKEDCRILCSMPHGVDIWVFEAGDEDNYNLMITAGATHWMPLPAPPRQRGKRGMG